MPLSGDMPLQNWGGTILPTEPGRMVVPRSVDEVVAAVQFAATAGKTVRCIGHGFSWLPVFFDAVRPWLHVQSLGNLY